MTIKTHEINFKDGVLNEANFLQTKNFCEELNIESHARLRPVIHTDSDLADKFNWDGEERSINFRYVAINRLLNHAYKSVDTSEASLVLWSFVMSDGMGDYDLVKQISKIFERHFKSVESVVVTAKSNVDKIKAIFGEMIGSQTIITCDKERMDLIYDGKTLSFEEALEVRSRSNNFEINSYFESYEYMKNLLLGNEKVETLIKAYNCMHVMMPAINNYSKAIFSPLIKENREIIWLYECGKGNHRNIFDAITNPMYHFRMGVGQTDLGLVYPPKLNVENLSLANLEDKALKTMLFGLDNPTEKDVAKFKKNNCFYFFYQSHGLDLMIYMSLLLSIKEQKNCTLCLPIKSLDDLNKDFLAQNNVSSVEFHKKSANGEINRQVEKISDEGKCTLRLFNAFPLKKADFNLLRGLKHNEIDLLGFMGDRSLAEGIVSKKPFVYSIREHKTEFALDLLALVRTRFDDKYRNFKDFFTLSMLFNSLNSKAIRETGQMEHEKKQMSDIEKTLKRIYTKPAPILQWLQKPAYIVAKGLVKKLLQKDCADGFALFSEILQKEYSAKKCLTEIIKREWCFIQMDEVAFISGEKPLRPEDKLMRRTMLRDPSISVLNAYTYLEAIVKERKVEIEVLKKAKEKLFTQKTWS